MKLRQVETKKERDQEVWRKRVAELHSQISIVGGQMTGFAEPSPSFQGGGNRRGYEYQDYKVSHFFIILHTTITHLLLSDGVLIIIFIITRL